MPKSRTQSDESRGAAGIGPSPESIARRAYELYEQRGREGGHELEDWLAAESELTASASAAPADKAEGRPAPAAGTDQEKRARPAEPRRRPVERRP